MTWHALEGDQSCYFLVICFSTLQPAANSQIPQRNSPGRTVEILGRIKYPV